jgi:RNA polymerase sigma factor (sigma-70 family)
MTGRRGPGGAPLRLVPPSGAEPTPAPEPHDELAELAAAAMRDEPGAVRTFLVLVLPQAFKAVRRVLGAHHPDVEDAVQESAANIMAALPRFRGEASVLHFACRVAALTAMNTRRRRAAHKRAVLLDDGASIDEVPNSERSPDEELVARQTAQTVRELLDTLPLEQAEVLALHSALGYTIAEIAAASSTPLETVRSRLRLAKRALRARALLDPRLRDRAEDSP